MSEKTINKHQAFSLMTIFEIGSTTLFALGIKAKQDAWLVILIAMVIGIVFVWIYTELQMGFPEKNFAEIIIILLGKKIGMPLAFLYAIYWLWPAARNLREFGELIVLTSLHNTPLLVVLITFMLTSIYVLLLGFNVLGRTSEIFMPIIIFYIISIFLLLIMSKEVNIKNLFPVLQDGMKPVLAAAFPNVVTFPFGEIFIFSMYWCYVDDKKAIRSSTILAILLTGILLSFTLAAYVTVLGVGYVSITTIPLVELVKMINIGEFFTNLDILAISIMFLGGFYKMSLFYYGYTMVIETVFKIKSKKLLLVLTGTFLLWVAYVFEPNYTYHQWMAPFDSNYFYIVFLLIIPLILFVIYKVKKKSGRLN